MFPRKISKTKYFSTCGRRSDVNAKVFPNAKVLSLGSFVLASYTVAKPLSSGWRLSIRYFKHPFGKGALIISNRQAPPRGNHSGLRD